MRLATALLAAVFLLSGGPDPAQSDPDWFVDPITVKVMHDRQKPFPSSTKAVDMAGQRGECERAQIWGWDDDADLTNVELQFGDLTSAGEATLPKAQWSYKQQGFVNATSPSHYTCLEDILTGDLKPKPPPPLPPHSDCSQTPWDTCWTGCPYVEKNWTDPKSCNGGKTKNPMDHGGKTNSPCTCNLCECNKQNTTCPADGRGADGHPCLSGWYPVRKPPSICASLATGIAPKSSARLACAQDPLLDIPTGGIPSIPKHFTQPIYIELCIPYGKDNRLQTMFLAGLHCSHRSPAVLQDRRLPITPVRSR
jgi:hypothetical protein